MGVARGIAIAAALVLAMMFAATAAIAAPTGLCKDVECRLLTLYPSGTTVKAATNAGSPATIAVGKLGEVECGSTVELKSTAVSGTPLPASVPSLGWSGCKVVGSEQLCTVSSVSLPFGASLSATTSGNGTVSLESNGEGGDPGVSVACGSVISCTFSATSFPLSFTGGAAGTAKLTASSVTLPNRTGSKCGSGATLTAGWVVSEPSPTFLYPPEPTRLCKVKETHCSSANTLGSGTALSWATAAGAPLKIENSLSTIECAGSMAGKINASFGEPMLGEITSSSLTGCVWGLGTCTATAVNLPWSAGFQELGVLGNGSVTLSPGSKGGNPGWTFVCGTSLNCTFSGSSLTAVVTGGKAAEGAIEFSKVSLSSSGSKCTTKQTLSGKLLLGTPAAGYWLTR